MNAPTPIRPDLDPASPSLNISLLTNALELAGAHAYEMGEDGYLDFADFAEVARFLVEQPGSLSARLSDWEARMEPSAVRARRRAIGNLTYVGARFALDYSLRDAMGTQRHVRETAEAIACADGRATLIRGVIIDRTTEALSDATIIWQSRHDSLTKLPNIAALTDAAGLVSGMAERLGVTAHLFRLRLSDLNQLTKTYGIDLSDRLIRETAARLNRTISAPDMVARLDGPDFSIICINQDVEAMASQLEAALSEEPYETPFGPLRPGLEIAGAPLGDVEAALSRTDAVLSDDPVPTPQTVRTPDMDVRDVLDRGRLCLAFQPVVHAVSGELHHHEALLRLRAENGDVSSAWQLILRAEEVGLVAELDARALDLATPYLINDLNLNLALNVSAGTVGDPAASEAYLERIRALGDVASRVTLEMTETLAVDDPAMAAKFSADARALGCRFAVDDFGSGHTTFRNLLAVEADCIKIDGSLVRGVATDENKQAFIRMMVDLAQTFSVETVAEMIEDRADALILGRLGVDYLQGYFFGRPSPLPVTNSSRDA